jgi:hypothetical protein
VETGNGAAIKMNGAIEKKMTAKAERKMDQP